MSQKTPPHAFGRLFVVLHTPVEDVDVRHRGLSKISIRRKNDEAAGNRTGPLSRARVHRCCHLTTPTFHVLCWARGGNTDHTVVLGFAYVSSATLQCARSSRRWLGAPGVGHHLGQIALRDAVDWSVPATSLFNCARVDGDWWLASMAEFWLRGVSCTTLTTRV